MEQALYLSITAFIVVVLAYSLLKIIRLSRQVDHLQHDLTESQALNDEITGEVRKIANEPIKPDMTDALTGLPGRQVFEDRLNQAIIQSGRQKSLFAVMAVDIDNFKEVDKKGADVGDKVLKELAGRLQMSVRQVDTVTRFAGGCFYFLLPHLNRAETAIYVAQRVQDNLLQSFKVDKHEVTITVSIGIAVYPLDGADSNGLIQNAMDAMRQAKSKGKNQYQFCQSDLQHLGQRELTLTHLVRSPEFLSKLQIQYRPYFNPDSNVVFYVQATPNLRDAKFGMVPFADFANIAESAGKMLEIHQWLLSNALEQCQRWSKEGFMPAHLAIPISLRQLENAHFVYAITEIMRHYTGTPVQLVLDIYDDKLPQNPIFIENLFNSLNEAKIKTAIGVIALGHFAMQKINKIPLNYLKIDSKLVAGATNFQDKEMILTKIIELARDEQITVIAEGIDNENQKIRLKKLGCDLMEGKAFGYLMPSGSVLEREV